jgi:hypothetical protein
VRVQEEYEEQVKRGDYNAYIGKEFIVGADGRKYDLRVVPVCRALLSRLLRVLIVPL